MSHTRATRATIRTIAVANVPITRALKIDLRVYSLDCLKRSAYRFTDRFAMDVRAEGDAAACRLIFDGHIGDDAADVTVAEFRKELLHQDLRSSIREETRQIRNLILSHAFSKTGLIRDESLPTD